MVNYEIEKIEGIGTVYNEKFRKIGINTVESLLENTKTKKQREELSQKTEINETLILRFANMADLFRIHGIGEEYSELLELSGVDTIIELSKRVPENLLETMSKVNEEKELSRKLPTLSQVNEWINSAKDLPRVLEY